MRASCSLMLLGTKTSSPASSSRSTPVSTVRSTAVTSSAALMVESMWPGIDPALSAAGTVVISTTLVEKRNRSRVGAIRVPSSLPNSPWARPSAGRMICGRPLALLLPGDQTRRFAQRAAMIPGFLDSAHSTRSRMPRDSQCECRHLKPGMVSGWLKMIVSDPGASATPPV